MKSSNDFISVHTMDGSEKLINENAIIGFFPTGDKMTITLVDGSAFYIKESMCDIKGNL